jgi:hypothetical protein
MRAFCTVRCPGADLALGGDVRAVGRDGRSGRSGIGMLRAGVVG